MLRPVRLALFLSLLAAGPAAASPEDLLHLPVGDPARSGKTVPLVLDAISGYDPDDEATIQT